MALRNQTSSVQNESADLDLQRLNAGFLGKLFGVGDSAPANIAGLAVILSLLLGAVMTYATLGSQKESPYEIWKYLTPIVTGGLGYLFGKESKKK